MISQHPVKSAISILFVLLAAFSQSALALDLVKKPTAKDDQTKLDIQAKSEEQASDKTLKTNTRNTETKDQESETNPEQAQDELIQDTAKKDGETSKMNENTAIINLNVWDGLSTEADKPIAEALEISRGAVTIHNKNDSNGDGKLDINQSPIKEGDPDLMKVEVVIGKRLANVNVLKLECSAGGLLWQGSKGTKLKNLGTTTLILLTPTGPNKFVYYLEGRSTSKMNKDQYVKVSYGRYVDEVRATFCWVNFVRMFNKEGMKLPETADDKQLNLVFADKNSSKDPVFANDFGHIVHNSGKKTIQTVKNGITRKVEIDRIGAYNRVGFEFRVSPKDVHLLSGVQIDVTRQAKGFTYARTPRGTITDATQLPANAIDTPNDDIHGVDEDNVPKNGFIYSLDTPGIQHIETSASIFQIYQTVHFSEYVVIRYNGAAFHKSSGGQEAINQKIPFTRCTDKVKWNTIMALEKAQAPGGGVWVVWAVSSNNVALPRSIAALGHKTSLSNPEQTKK